ncbi:MAG: methionyl-tRNA formyltransferase [Clostridia bacterium]|nr:methionyl-tRNA formyltransferase [Clostridia bacterium]
MRILFMGTPEISALALKQLIADGKNIVGIVTREDKPRGRGNVMTPTPVKLLGVENGIPVITPRSLKEESFQEFLTATSPELIVVVAYGKILPREVLEYPQNGCINLHVSLLPKYRGAAPMQRAIMAGERETGVTVMYMNEGLDTGDIIAAESFPISADDDFEAIHDRSAVVGSALLSRTVDAIANGTAKRVPQDDSQATYAAKIEKADCRVDFTKDARELDFMIRGVTPIPGAFAYLGGKMIKICRATPTDKSGACGEVIGLNSSKDGSILIACGKGSLSVSSLIPEGKGRMSAADFIRGRKVNLGDVFE